MFQATFHTPLDDPKRHGICAGLAVLWVDRRIMWHHETPQQRRDGLYSDPGLAWGDKLQDIKGGTWSMYSRILQRRSIALTGETGWSANVGKSSVKAAAQEIARKVIGQHKYYLWIFDNDPTGIGHMVASYASGGKLGLNRHLYFFDANMGEYIVSISDAEKFVHGLINAYRNEKFPIKAIYCLAVHRGACLTLHSFRQATTAGRDTDRLSAAGVSYPEKSAKGLLDPRKREKEKAAVQELRSKLKKAPFPSGPVLVRELIQLLENDHRTAGPFNENGQLWGKLGESAEQMLGEGMSGYYDWRSPTTNMMKHAAALQASMNQKT